MASRQPLPRPAPISRSCRARRTSRRRLPRSARPAAGRSAPKSATSRTARRCAGRSEISAALDVLINNAGLELITPMLEPGERGGEDFRPHHRDQRHRHLLRDARSAAADAGRRGDRAHLVDLGEDRRGGLFRLRDLEARQYRLHARAREGAWSEGHPRECRLPGLGQDAGGAPLARRRFPPLPVSTRIRCSGRSSRRRRCRA